ncbi:MAG: mandelate racemase/muconate lactonizing enzyme family protein [Lacunisphaera sp.]|nr:mandelate racemase/muconate lactonizing enzyme family protein [Lacunisphaera sp.]
MKTTRRDFLATAALAGGSAALLPLSARAATSTRRPDYTPLDLALKQPVLKREYFPAPVIIETLELLRDRDNFICRVRSKDGAEGISLGHPFISKQGYPLFTHALQRQFIGQDARDLDHLIYLATERNVKIQGVPLCVQIATIEFAILDLLGNLARRPVRELIGDLLHPEISIYLGHLLSEMRRLPPEESLVLLAKDQRETQAKALKLRAGRGDNLASDIDNAPGRTEKLIRLAREKFGPAMTLMIDGNGSYSVQEAIRIGRILEEQKYYFYEEPLPWDWYEDQKIVADTLAIKMAGGEEEFSLRNFRWLIAHDAFDILQPDLFYFGGMIRTMQVARMAAVAGKTIAPHMSGGGLGYVYLMNFVPSCPNAERFHEFKMSETTDANGTLVPIQSKGEPFTCVDGILKAPTGTGLGLTIDPAYVRTHRPVAV